MHNNKLVPISSFSDRTPRVESNCYTIRKTKNEIHKNETQETGHIIDRIPLLELYWNLLPHWCFEDDLNAYYSHQLI